MDRARMTAGEDNERQEARAKGHRRYLSSWHIYLSIILSVIFVLFFFWLARFLMGKPLVTITNKDFKNLSKPADYDPNLDAAPLYLSLIREFSEIPRPVAEYLGSWPTDVNTDDLQTISDWLTEKGEAIESAQQAASRPYCWTPGKNALQEKIVWLPDVGRALLCRSILNAYRGQYQSAAEDLVTCYKAGKQLAGPKPIVEQLVGLVMRASVVEAAFTILAYSPQDEQLIRLFDESFQQLIPADSTFFDLQYEKLFWTYQIQRAFTENGRGDGHLLPSIRYVATYQALPDKSETVQWKYKPSVLDYTPRNIWYAATCPRKTQTLELLEKCFVHLQKVALVSPKESRGKTNKKLKELQAEVNEKSFLKSSPWTGSHMELIERARRIRINELGLLVTLKILSYKLEKGEFPQSLDDVAAAGYIEYLPMDPYSDGSLVYRRRGDDFLLYSLGVDFDDDGGVRSQWGEDETGGDQVFWPVERPDGKSN